MMVVAQWDQIVGYDEMTFLPFTRYVVSEATFENVSRSVVNDGGRIISQSSFNNFQKSTRKPKTARKVAVYRHTAYGDQLITTGFTAFLKHIWPDCRIFYFCSPKITDVWRWNPHIEFCGGPMPFETVVNMDDHFFFEMMFESNMEPDQMNCYDSMLQFAGFDAEDVPAEFKRPYIFFNEKELGLQRGLREKHGDYVLYHWASSNPNRMYPPESSVATLQLLSANGYKVIVMGHDPTSFNLPEIPHVYDLRNKTRYFRDVMHFVSQATMVIGPDSSLMHVAAALKTPCISLWGLFHPDDRIKYYPNSFPIRGFEACPHAPCRNHDFKLPAVYCRDAKNHVEPPEFCNALRAIHPLQIMRAVTIINDKYKHGRIQSTRTPTQSTNPIPPQAGPLEVPLHRGTEVG